MLAVLAGLPVAFLLARVLLPGIALVRTLVLVPFVLPTVVVGLAFDGGVASIVLANAFFNVALLARTVLLRRCADPGRRGLPDLGNRDLPPHGEPAQPVGRGGCRSSSSPRWWPPSPSARWHASAGKPHCACAPVRKTARRPERGEWWVVAGGCAVRGLLLADHRTGGQVRVHIGRLGFAGYRALAGRGAQEATLIGRPVELNNQMAYGSRCRWRSR
jgi:hypothetical protein